MVDCLHSQDTDKPATRVMADRGKPLQRTTRSATIEKELYIALSSMETKATTGRAATATGAAAAAAAKAGKRSTSLSPITERAERPSASGETSREKARKPVGVEVATNINAAARRIVEATHFEAGVKKNFTRDDQQTVQRSVTEIKDACFELMAWVAAHREEIGILKQEACTRPERVDEEELQVSQATIQALQAEVRVLQAEKMALQAEKKALQAENVALQARPTATPAAAFQAPAAKTKPQKKTMAEAVKSGLRATTTPTAASAEASTSATPAAKTTTEGFTTVTRRQRKPMTMSKTTPRFETVVKIDGKTSAEVAKGIAATVKLADIGSSLKSISELKNGKVVLRCNDVAQKERLETALAKNNELIIKGDTGLNPTITITGVDAELRGEELAAGIYRDNDEIRNFCSEAEFGEKFVFLARRKCRNDRKANVVFSAEPALQKVILGLKKVVVGLVKLYVEEEIRVTRCFNCNGYGHKSSMCKQAACCPKCGGEHDLKSCTAVAPQCPNCKRAGIKDTAHKASQTDRCGVYRRRVQQKMGRVASNQRN